MLRPRFELGARVLVCLAATPTERSTDGGNRTHGLWCERPASLASGDSISRSTSGGIRTRVATSKGLQDCLIAWCPLPYGSMRYYKRKRPEETHWVRMLAKGFEPLSTARKAIMIGRTTPSERVEPIWDVGTLPYEFFDTCFPHHPCRGIPTGLTGFSPSGGFIDRHMVSVAVSPTAMGIPSPRRRRAGE